MKRRNAILLAIILAGPVLGQSFPPPSDAPYGASWNGSRIAASRNAIYDKIEAIIVGALDPILSDIVTQNPAANEMLYWTAPGTSATLTSTALGRSVLTQATALTLAQTVDQDRTIDVRWTGAVGNGVADDTAAVQLAITTLTAGGTVWFPAGTYIVEGVDVASNITLAGDGSAVLKLKANATDGILNIETLTHVTVRGLRFDGNVTNQTIASVPQTREIVDVNDSDYVRVLDCTFINLLENCIDFYLSSNCWVERCTFIGNTSGAVTETANCDVHATTCDYVTVRGNQMLHTSPTDPNHGFVGAFFSGVSSGWIEANTMTYAGRSAGGGHQGGAVDLYNSTNSDIHVTDNHIDQFCYMGVRVRGSNAWINNNSIIADPCLAAGSGSCIEFSHSTDAMVNLWACHNFLSGAGTIGEGIYSVSGSAAGNGNFAGLHFDDNTITNVSRGIYIRYSASGFSVCRNRITDCKNQAIITADDTDLLLRDGQVNENIIDMAGSDNVQAIALNVTAAVTCMGNRIENAYQGIGCWIPAGGVLAWNTVEASSYEYLYYNETQDLVSIGNRVLGTGDTIYHNGTDEITEINVDYLDKGEFSTTIYDDGDWDGEAIPIWQAPAGYGVVVTTVRATAMGTTPTLTYNIEERAYGSLASAGTDIYAADQAADSNGETETSFGNDAIAAGAHLVFTTGTGAETNTVTAITLTVTYRRAW